MGRTTTKKQEVLPRGVRKLGPGLWQIRSQVTSRRTGRVVERSLRVRGRLRDAVAAKVELDEAIRSGEEEQRDERLSVRDYAVRWQDRKRDEGRAESTLRARADILVDHVLPFLGSYDLRCLTPADLLDWRRWALRRTDRRGEPYSPVTVNGWWRVVKALVRSGFAEFQLGRSPTDAMRPLPEAVPDEDEDRTLVEEEVLRLLQELKVTRPALMPYAVMGFATGCRHSELSALRWEDLDWERRTVRVRRSHVNGVVRQGGKTRGSMRRVVLLPSVVALLRSHREGLAKAEAPGLEEGWMFPSKAGTPLSTASASDGLKRAAARAGIERKVSTKTFRRTWNTQAIRVGLDRALIQANTGHSTDAMTTHYARFRPEDQQRAQQQVVGFLGRLAPGVQE